MGVFSEIKPKNSARKNPFDRGKKLQYNTKCGLMIPLKQWPTLPSSEYELDLKALLRTQPLGTAAFAGFSINYDVVWTPFNDHYSAFNQFIAQRINKQHTTQPDIRHIPTFSVYKYLLNIIPIAVYDYFLAELPVNQRNYFVDDYIQIDFPRRSLFHSVHMPDESMALNSLRTLDMLGYGNYLPVIKGVVTAFKNLLDSANYSQQGDESLPYVIRYCALWLKDVHNQPMYDWDSNEFIYDLRSIWSFDLALDVYYERFADKVDFENLNSNYLSLYGLNISNLLRENGQLTMWPILCYNKAWWQFYRNEYYDIDYEFMYFDELWNSHTIEYVYMFNMDDLDGELPIAVGDPVTPAFLRILSMLAIKPHQYKKDLFTGLLPSTQYGSVSTALTDTDFHKLLGNVHDSSSTSLSAGQIYGNDNGALIVRSSPTTANTRVDKFKVDPALAISVLELRRADSLQRFKERMLRAGNKTKDIFKAHGWDEPFSEKAFEAQFFGSFDGRLDINVVASTTDTETVNLGQLGANGIGVIGGQTIHFKSRDFGTLMVIAYITKDAVYDSYGIDKCHTLVESWDFPYPELQNVSLAPIVEKQVNAFGRNGDQNNALGFLPQNMAWKTEVDSAHGEFFTVSPFVDSDKPNHVHVNGIFSNMVTSRIDINDPKALSFFYLQSNCADNIFVENADETQESDQFFGTVSLDLKAVQPLDVIGLPI